MWKAAPVWIYRKLLVDSSPGIQLGLSFGNNGFGAGSVELGYELVDLSVYENLGEFFAQNGDAGLWLATTKAPRSYAGADFRGDVTLMFGKETAGLPAWLREKYRERCIRIPMVDPARSLNLSNSVAILAYEALRQQGFPGLLGVGEMAEK